MKTTTILCNKYDVMINCPHCDSWETIGIDTARHKVQNFILEEFLPIESKDIPEKSLMICGDCNKKFILIWDYKNVEFTKKNFIKKHTIGYRSRWDNKGTHYDQSIKIDNKTLDVINDKIRSYRAMYEGKLQYKERLFLKPITGEYMNLTQRDFLFANLITAPDRAIDSSRYLDRNTYLIITK